MKKTSVIPIRLIHADHDTDWDGVPNRIDCDIFNPNRQGRFHTSRYYVKKTRFYDPSMIKSYKERTKQIKAWRKKTKNEISTKMFGTTFDNLSQQKKRDVNRVWIMQTHGV